jgi:ABC-2 type transport system ATP-binding protein
LDALGIAPTDIGIHRATLDDVFLTLTGQTAASAEDTPEESGPGGGRGGRSRRAGKGGSR